jgi:enoyl-[acyl-carrier protein] reductase II
MDRKTSEPILGDVTRRRLMQVLGTGGMAVALGVAPRAQAAMALGLDGLVAQGEEAGGHCKSTTPLHHLLRDIRDELGDNVLVLAAGGIATGADVVAALAQGADGV